MFGQRSSSVLALVLTLAVCVGALGCRSDKKSSASPPQTTERPALRIIAFGGAAGAIEPCGCVKDMLGGIDHAAALVRDSRSKASGLLVLGAGPMFFQDPALVPEAVVQANLKADTMAASLQDLGLVAWAPGANDWAETAQHFQRLVQSSGALALAANLPPASRVSQGTALIDRAGLKVGLVGISVPEFRGKPLGFDFGDPSSALARGLADLKSRGAQITVALIASPRGQALRLVEGAPSLTLAVLGKPFDQGENNDEPFEPMLLGNTLVVQGQNHLQGAAIVDLFIRDDSFEFKDGSGLREAQQRASLKRRIQRLEGRIADVRRDEENPQRSKEKQAELTRLKAELAAIPSPQPPSQGSYFLYDLTFVREDLGQDPAVGSRLLAYYKRVNELNRERFRDKRPVPPAEGESGYVGVDQCTVCHQEERAFWQTTGHASAYATLERDHKQFNLDCVSCHVTGYEKPGGSTVTFVDGLSNVQCETCHGPGSRHVTDPANPAWIVSAPSPELCPTCHHPPHVTEEWTVGEAFPHILGPGHGLPRPSAP